MFKAEQIAIQYVPSNTIEKQGKRCSIERFLREGYYVKLSRNGYWVLVKPSQVLVTCYCGKNGTFTYDMKSDILKYHNRKKISFSLIDKFKNDFKSNVILIEVDESGYSFKY